MTNTTISSAQSLKNKQAAITEMVTRMVPAAGDHPTLIPGLTLHRRNSVTEPLHCIYSLSLSFVIQGEKKIYLGDEVLNCRQGQSMLTTLDLPVVSHVSKASPQKPFLAVLIKLDPTLIFAINAEMELPKPSRDWTYRTLSCEDYDAGLCDAVLRLVHSLGDPALVEHIAPLIQKEIIIRLLKGPHARNLRMLVSQGSPSEHIANTVAWLKVHFKESISMDELAERSHMSASTFRQHFKTITGLSPLQYQKQLRLQEARDLMLSQNMDASFASSQVGYESASQFSREYSRLFGASPSADMKKFRGS